MNLTKAATTYWKVTVTGVIFVAIAGIYTLLTMPRREDPKVTIREALVVTLFPGADSEKVEQLITRKVEEKLESIEEVMRITSTSRGSLSVVRLKLHPNVNDTFRVWDRVRNKMRELQPELPPGIYGPKVDDEYGDTVAQLIAVSGNGYTQRQLEDFGTTIETELRRIPTIGKTEIVGKREEQIQLTVSMEKLSQHRTSPSQLIRALQARNITLPGGELDTSKAEVALQPSGELNRVADIGDIMVDVSQGGLPVRIGDVATVSRMPEDPKFITRYNGQPAIFLSVTMRAGENVVKLGKQVSDALATVRGRLPNDVSISTIADQPKVVDERISHFLREFLMAIACVICVTLILLPFRTSLVAATAIPITVIATFALMRVFGIELHQVSISTLILAIGMVVDDAIVITDNYHEHLEKGKSPFRAAVDGATEVAVPVLAATLTIVASFMPLRMVSGAVGEFISGIPNVIAISLLTSYAVAIVVTPLLCSWLIHSDHANTEENILGRVRFVRERWPALTRNPLDALRTSYRGLLRGAMAHKRVTTGLAFASVVLGVAAIPRLGIQFFPKAERNQFVIDVWTPEGTRIERTDELAREMEEKLRSASEVTGFAAYVGKSPPRFYYNISPELNATNYAQFIVNTQDEKQVPDLVERLRANVTATMPGARVLVKELEQGEPVEAPIMVRISGDDIPELKRMGARVEGVLRGVPGVWGISNDYGEDVSQLAVKINPDAASPVGVTNYETALMLRGSLSGAPVSYYREGKRNVPIVLRLEESERQEVDQLMNLYIPTVTGGKVPLKQIATIEPEWQTARIQRRGRARTLTVRGFVAGRLVTAALKEARPRIAALPLPQGYRIEYGGEQEGMERSFGELTVALGVGVMLIFIILVLEFNSLLQPLLVMTSIPLSLGGAVLGLALTGSPFGFMAFLGVVSLAGVVVRNAIVLIDYANQVRRSGATPEEAAEEAGMRRLRPILLTTLAAVVGMTPMLLSGSTLWVPMASAIAAGLLGSTLLTLVVLPVLYVVLERAGRRDREIDREVDFDAVPQEVR